VTLNVSNCATTTPRPYKTTIINSSYIPAMKYISKDNAMSIIALS